MLAIHPSQIVLETERLILRYQQASDVPALIDLWTDPEVTRYMGGPRDRATLVPILEETAAEPLAETYDLWPVVEKASGEVVGHCGLLDKEVAGRREVELVYVFRRASWGRGYATEMAAGIKHHAFETLGLTRLIALIEPENAASERVAVKVGMRFEKEVIRPDGETRRLYVVESSSSRHKWDTNHHRDHGQHPE